MKITKERARSPLVDNGTFGSGANYTDGKPTYTLSCFGPWTQGKGHESAYTMHLSKIEMLAVVRSWLSVLVEEEIRALHHRSGEGTRE